MQNPSSHGTQDPDLFYDVDEAGNPVRRSTSTRTSSTASRHGLGDEAETRIFDYDRHGRLERIGRVLWSATPPTGKEGTAART